ncbi:MAG: hypothetical protein IBX55_15950 [Methyloprofundus sp.]|nr:hypothetical protein [Methyloprofundus sp.]
MNQVDTSPETVEKEWQKIADNWGVDLESSGDAPDGGESKKPQVILSAEDRAEKEAITAGLIKGSLGMVYGMLDLTDMPENITNDFCQTWAVVIVKRFPENPITDFMSEYGDLIAAGSASLMLFGAGKRIKASRQELAGKVKQNMQKQTEKTPETEVGHKRQPLAEQEGAA